ncbi:MAG: hypothetical protein GXP31_08650 [Kiritimatiellaeota bacterium]|nr:hypothetical protein [Kiritimatiellota bacterium]
MRILREKDLQILWSWGRNERDHLVRTYQSNLVELLKTVQARVQSSDPLPTEEVDALAREVQEAGEILEQGMSTCFALAGILYVMGGKDAEEQSRRQEYLSRLTSQKGEKVRVVRTSVRELLGRELLLEDVHGFKAVLWDGDGHWETPVDRVEPLEATEEVTAKSLPPLKTAGASVPPKSKTDTTAVLRRRSRTEKARQLKDKPLPQQRGAGTSTQTQTRLRPTQKGPAPTPGGE